MTETKVREEIDLRTLAGKFAEGDKAKLRVWAKTLLDAVKAGTLQARQERRLLHGVTRRLLPSGVSRRPVTTEFATFAGMPARVVHTLPPARPIEGRFYWFTRAAVAAWLGKVEAPPLVRIWLGETLAPESAADPGKAASISNETPPGTLPGVGCGALAVKAAWQIERETGRLATAKPVMKRLQEWADLGKESDCLIRRLPGYAVEWWAKGMPKTYDFEACRTTLRRWNESRKSGQ